MPPEKWPEPDLVIEFKTPEDAHRMADFLSDQFSKIRGEMDGMWEHVRQLEAQVALINTFISLGGASRQ